MTEPNKEETFTLWVNVPSSHHAQVLCGEPVKNQPTQGEHQLDTENITSKGFSYCEATVLTTAPTCQLCYYDCQKKKPAAASEFSLAEETCFISPPSAATSVSPLSVEPLLPIFQTLHLCDI